MLIQSVKPVTYWTHKDGSHLGSLCLFCFCKLHLMESDLLWQQLYLTIGSVPWKSSSFYCTGRARVPLSNYRFHRAYAPANPVKDRSTWTKWICGGSISWFRRNMTNDQKTEDKMEEKAGLGDLWNLSLVIKRYQWCSSNGNSAFICVISLHTGEAIKKIGKLQIVLCKKTPSRKKSPFQKWKYDFFNNYSRCTRETNKPNSSFVCWVSLENDVHFQYVTIIIWFYA